jgi:hypothetical protein
MCDERDSDLFERLQYLSITYPDKVEVFIDEDGEAEFEIEFDYFFDNLKKIFGF